MKVAVMWTISDFPGYGMLSGWTTQGRLACPICIEDSKAFKLEEGGKICWFDCHRRFLPEHHPSHFQEDSFRKNTIELDPPPSRLMGEEVFERISSLDQITFGSKNKKDKIPGYGEEHNWNKKSIFCMLPYWKNLLVRHNIDLMHLENNFFGNFFHTAWDTKDKTKDNGKARSDMAKLCHRPGLELRRNSVGKIEKPKSSYCLTKEQKRAICEWANNLRFPDGYASNLSNSVNLEEYKFVGMKSHDCHIFMERLLPIAFRDFVPEGV
jgi:Transposase family tnp2